jgi:hypothetical protein
MSDRGRAKRPANVRAAPFVTLMLAGRAMLHLAPSARAMIPASPKLRVERVKDLRI